LDERAYALAGGSKNGAFAVTGGEELSADNDRFLRGDFIDFAACVSSLGVTGAHSCGLSVDAEVRCALSKRDVKLNDALGDLGGEI
jgi:hypothetical protein